MQQDPDIAQLSTLIERASRVVLFTGAGISTESGISDFRSPGGIWSRNAPIDFEAFVRSEDVRQEAWRRFAQELQGSRRSEHADSRQRLGITGEQVWLRQAPGDDIAIFCLQAEEPEGIISEIILSRRPFESWFRTQMLLLHGLGTTNMPVGPGCELIFEWKSYADSCSNVIAGSPVEEH